MAIGRGKIILSFSWVERLAGGAYCADQDKSVGLRASHLRDQISSQAGTRLPRKGAILTLWRRVEREREKGRRGEVAVFDGR